MSETKLVKSIVDAINMRGAGHAMRLNSGSIVLGEGKRKRMLQACEPGTPDILVLRLGGHVVWLEAKTQHGKVTTAQKLWHEMARKLGHLVYVVRSQHEAMDALGDASLVDLRKEFADV